MTTKLPINTAKEWAKCLADPVYAETTWLRINPEAERRALIALKITAALVFVGAVLAFNLCVQRYNEARNWTVEIQNSQQRN